MTVNLLLLAIGHPVSKGGACAGATILVAPTSKNDPPALDRALRGAVPCLGVILLAITNVLVVARPEIYRLPYCRRQRRRRKGHCGAGQRNDAGLQGSCRRALPGHKRRPAAHLAGRFRLTGPVPALGPPAGFRQIVATLPTPAQRHDLLIVSPDCPRGNGVRLDRLRLVYGRARTAAAADNDHHRPPDFGGKPARTPGRTRPRR